LQELTGAVVIRNRAVDASCGIRKVVVPLGEVAVWGERAVVAAGLQVNFDMFYPPRTGFQVAGEISTATQGSAGHAYVNIFWYISGQLVILPQAILRWTKSKDSSPRAHGLS
jgi:hypothetical protein